MSYRNLCCYHIICSAIPELVIPTLNGNQSVFYALCELLRRTKELYTYLYFNKISIFKLSIQI